MTEVTIRLETEADHRAVEELAREAFWNLYMPGCSEHYTTHILRKHPDFIPELDFVAEVNNRIVGMICKVEMPEGEYTLRSRTIDAKGAAQPMPRPFRKSGHAAIEQVKIRVLS